MSHPSRSFVRELTASQWSGKLSPMFKTGNDCSESNGRIPRRNVIKLSRWTTYAESASCAAG